VEHIQLEPFRSKAGTSRSDSQESVEIVAVLKRHSSAGERNPVVAREPHMSSRAGRNRRNKRVHTSFTHTQQKHPRRVFLLCTELICFYFPILTSFRLWNAGNRTSLIKKNVPTRRITSNNAPPMFSALLQFVICKKSPFTRSTTHTKTIALLG